MCSNAAFLPSRYAGSVKDGASYISGRDCFEVLDGSIGAPTRDPHVPLFKPNTVPYLSAPTAHTRHSFLVRRQNNSKSCPVYLRGRRDSVAPSRACSQSAPQTLL